MVASARLALSQIRRSPLRSLLAAVAVAFAVATLIGAEVISESVTAEITRTAESEAITGFMSEQMNVGLTTIGLVISAGAGFLLFNNISMSIAQRRADLGRFRVVGMTRGQLAGMILLEALFLGILGSLLGLVMGVFVGRGLIRLVESTSDLFNQFGTGQVSISRLVFSTLIGMGISIIAALAPAIRVLQLTPLDALRHSPPEGVRTISTLWPFVGLLGGILIWLYLALAPPGRWALLETANQLSILFVILWMVCLIALLPALAELAGRLARITLAKLAGGVSWLAGDNLRRSRGRVGLSIFTLAIATGMIVAVSGYLTYWFDELFFRTPAISLKESPAVGFFPIDVETGLEAYRSVSSFSMPEGFREKVEAQVGDHGSVAEAYFVLAPEISFLGESYFSFVLDIEEIRAAGDLFFSFTYGDWEQAQSLANEGCVLFVTPGVAQRNDAWLGEPITIQTPTGALDCTIAGIGPTNVGASIISSSAIPSYQLLSPVAVIVFPHSQQDRTFLLPELQALADETPGVWTIDLSRMTEYQKEGMKSVRVAMNGMLILAVLAAALGVVNMTVITIIERRRELGILRAVGATRDQVHKMISIEGFLVGLLGSILGVILGAGLVLGYVVISAGSPMGFPNFPIWTAAWNSTRPALIPGMIAVLITPLLTSLSARIPAGRMLDSSIVEMLGQRQGLG